MRHGLNPYTINLTAIGDSLGLHTGPLIHASETPTFLLLFRISDPIDAGSCVLAMDRAESRHAGGSHVPATGAAAGNRIRYGMAAGRANSRVPSGGVEFLLGTVSSNDLVPCSCWLWARWKAITMPRGLLIAIAGLLRAFPFLLLGYFLLRRQWRALRFAIGGAIVGVIFTVLMVGFARCLSFVHGALYVANHDRMIFPFVLSLAPFVSRMVWSLGFTSEAVRIAAVLTATALLFSVTIRTTIQSASKPDADFRIFSLWIVSSVILSPVAWHHYLVLLIFPSRTNCSGGRTGQRQRRAIWIAAASYALGSISQILDYQLLTQPTSFQLLHPSISAPIPGNGLLHSADGLHCGILVFG